jgi:hypothetical protein
MTAAPPPATQRTEPVAWIQPDHLAKAREAPFLCRVEPQQRDDFIPIYAAPRTESAASADPRHLTSDEQGMLGRALFKSAKVVRSAANRTSRQVIAPQFVALSLLVSGRAFRDSPNLSVCDCIAWAIERDGDPVDLPPLVERSLAIGTASVRSATP